MLQFESIAVQKIGTKCGLRDHQWAQLELRLRDDETDHSHAVAIDVLLPRRPDATMSELEEAARTEAITMLEAALGQLRGSSVAELRTQEYAAEDEEQARLAQQIADVGNFRPVS